MTLQVLRPSAKSIGLTVGPFKNGQNQAIRKLYPPFDDLDYVIFSGCVWIPLSTNVLEALSDNKNLCSFIPYSSRNKARIMLSKIFPDNDIKDTEALEASDVLTKVNEVEVFSLDDFRNELLAIKTNSKKNHHHYVTLTFKSSKELVISLSKANEQDKNIHNNFKINPNEFSRKLWV